LPAEVVLESHHRDHGGFAVEHDIGSLPAEQADELVADDARNFLGGRKLGEHLSADRLLLDARGEVPHDRERDVRFEQREANLAQGRLEVEVREVTFPSQVLEDSLDAFRQTLEHG
jgi:hypothetical protein